MINLKARLILVTVLGFFAALLTISCLTLIPMKNIIDDKLFKLGKDKLSHLECSAKADLRES